MFLCDFVWFCVYLYCFCVYFVQILYSHPTFVAIVCVFRSFCVYCVHCVPFWRVCTVCVVCVVYTVSRFGLFVQCVLWPMCTNPVFHCLQCVPNELFIKVLRLGVSRKCTLYTLPFWRVCTHPRFGVFVQCVLCVFCTLCPVWPYCVCIVCIPCVYCVCIVYIPCICVYIVWFVCILCSFVCILCGFVCILCGFV